MTDETALVTRARAGDPEAFAALVEQYDRGLRALAFRLLGSRQQMDDVLQDAYLNAFRSLPAFEGRSAFRSWLYRIVYNACLDELRRRGRLRQVPIDQAEDRPHPGPDPAEVAAHRRDLGAALATLSPDLRATVLLVDAEGMGYEEAAGVLGIPAGTVRSRISRARAILRRALSGSSNEPKGREER